MTAALYLPASEKSSSSSLQLSFCSSVYKLLHFPSRDLKADKHLRQLPARSSLGAGCRASSSTAGKLAVSMQGREVSLQGKQGTRRAPPPLPSAWGRGRSPCRKTAHATQPATSSSLYSVTSVSEIKRPGFGKHSKQAHTARPRPSPTAQNKDLS